MFLYDTWFVSDSQCLFEYFLFLKNDSHQETMNMSKDAIYDQLTSEYGEKFTAEEAQYAIDNLDD